MKEEKTMTINLFNQYTKEIKFDFKKIIDDIEKGFESDKSASLVLVDNDEIHRINKEYRGKDYVTDVISFEESDEEDLDYLGDIFLSVDKAIDQAEVYGHSIEREFAFLIIHGLLHLHGYDHLTKEDEEVMFSKQHEILERLNYRR